MIKIKDKEEVLEEEILEDIYSEEWREEMLANDELEPFEAAFMEGYDAA